MSIAKNIITIMPFTKDFTKIIILWIYSFCIEVAIT